MRGLSKKMLISILTSVIVFVTMVATTFAWVGIFTYANTDKFSLNLKVQELDSNYFLEISNTGEKGSFSSEINPIDIKRQIVNNRYNNRYADEDDDIIEKVYSKIQLEPISTTINEDNEFDSFYSIEYNAYQLFMNESYDYYKFDMYLSVNTKEGISDYTSPDPTTGIRSNVLLSSIESTLEGTFTSGVLSNGNPFVDMPSEQLGNEFDVLRTIPHRYKINSKNSVRFGLSLYEPILITDEYDGSEKPTITKIFEGGNELPSYDDTTESYDLGGCLPVDKNLAIYELLTYKPALYKGNPDEFNYRQSLAMSRGDLELKKENCYLWKSHEHDSYLGCMDGYQTKMKITVHFWFEGWDADCLKLIEEMPVSLNLAFIAGIND